MVYLSLLLSIGVFFLLLMPIFIAYQKKPIDFLDPVFFVMLSVGIGVVARGVYLVTLEKSGLRDYIGFRDVTDIISGYFFVFVALFSFVIGCAISAPKTIELSGILSDKDWSHKKVVIVSAFLVLVALYFWYQFIKAIDLDSMVFLSISQKRAVLDESGKKVATGYLRWGASLSVLAYYISLISSCRKESIGNLSVFVLVALFFLSIAFPIFTSSRIEVVSVVANTVLIVHFQKSRINRTFEARLAWRLLAVVLLITVATAVLSSFRKGEVGNLDAYEIFSTKKMLNSIVGNQNFYGIGKSVVALKETNNYLYGRSIVSLVTAPIPRDLWNSKPEVGMSYYFGSNYYEIDYTGNQGGGMPPGISVELFINFGWVGMILGMWLYGFFMRIYYSSIAKYLYARNMDAILIHVIVLMPITFYMTGNDIAQALIAMFVYLIPGLFVLKLIRS